MIELEELVKIFTLSLGSVVEGVAAIIIAYAILRAFVLYLRSSIPNSIIDQMVIRLSLGKALALALEFLLAADILRTAVAPNWDDIGKLAAIAILRTLLNYFLERELKHAEIKT
jgi:uncharacterized membrane protein